MGIFWFRILFAAPNDDDDENNNFLSLLANTSANPRGELLARVSVRVGVGVGLGSVNWPRMRLDDN